MAPAQAAPPGLPDWKEPNAYSVDLVMTGRGETVVMKRFLDKGRIRTDSRVDDRQMVLIELADAARTTYMLLPEEKMAIKRSVADEARAAREPPAEPGAAESGSGAEIELVGDGTLDGKPTRKYRLPNDEGSLLAWFDAGTGAPGASLGASFGGPMGAVAGRYLGGRLGGWLGRRVVGAVLPGQ